MPYARRIPVLSVGQGAYLTEIAGYRHGTPATHALNSYLHLHRLA